MSSLKIVMEELFRLFASCMLFGDESDDDCCAGSDAADVQVEQVEDVEDIEDVEDVQVDDVSPNQAIQPTEYMMPAGKVQVNDVQPTEYMMPTGNVQVEQVVQVEHIVIEISPVDDADDTSISEDIAAIYTDHILDTADTADNVNALIESFSAKAGVHIEETIDEYHYSSSDYLDEYDGDLCSEPEI